MTHFRIHQDVAVVEHDDATRKPLKGGQVHGATVTGTNSVFTIVELTFSSRKRCPVLFDTGSGWAAAHAEYRWRLVPRCTRCDEPITGTPVTDPDDRSGRVYCSGDCRDSDAEGAGEQWYPSGVAT